MENKRFKILLVYPNLMMKHILSPAIGILSSELKNNGFDVDLFDTTYYLTETENPDRKRKELLQVRTYDVSDYGIKVKDTDVFDDFKDKVKQFSPDLIGVTTVEDTMDLSLRLIRSLGENRPKTIFGGIYISYLNDKAFNYKEIDMICLGEGEQALVELCTRLSEGRNHDDIQNIYLRKNGTIIKNKLRGLVNLDQLPIPDYSLFEESRFYSPMQGKMYRMLPIDFDRGCPYNCTFCASPSYRDWYRKQNGENYSRKKSPKKIIEEMEHLAEKYKPQYLYFNSDTFFTFKDEALRELLVNIKEKINLPFWCQTRAETVTEDKMRLLKDCGCDRVTMGLEHGNEEFRSRVVGKNFTNQQFIEAAEVIKKIGIPLSINNIIGFPYDTRDLVFDSIGLNKRINPDSISVFIFYPYTGTKLYRLCLEKDLINSNVTGSTLLQNSVIKNENLSKDHLNRLLKTFCLYVRFPKKRWEEIKKVEMNAPGADEIFSKLSQEYQEKYF